MRELRKSLSPWGEQQFWGMQMRPVSVSERFPPFGNEQCWKKDQYVEKKCGPFPVLPYRSATLAQSQ
jgi:hypothetical protein